MISLFNIKTVARFESKTLLRSWFFRIFAIIIIAFILMFNIFGLAGVGDGGWPGRLLPSGAPYFNMWLLNIAQAVIAVFLSADFLGRDKKLDTTEAFYVRSMSNVDYVFGKTLGILKVFLFLNIFVLASGIIFSLIANEFTIPWLSYLFYPLLMSLPTLVCVLGLAFFTMTLIRNQAVTFVLLLGFLALSLFYLRNKYYALFDILGFYTPFMRSDFTGFQDLDYLVMHRSIYLLLGIVLILATVWRLPRLEQQKFSRSTVVSGIIILLFITGGGVMKLINQSLKSDNLLAHIQKLNAELKPSDFKIDQYDIQLHHRGKIIECDVKMQVSKNGSSKDLLLVLNPGLEVSTCKTGNQELNFEQDGHLLRIKLPETFPNIVTIQLSYKGVTLDQAMYADISEESKLAENRKDPLLAGKQYSFVKENYVLLTREAMWYPVVADKQYWTHYPFVEMNLEVNTLPNLEVISQGKKDSLDVGKYTFSPEMPLNAYSLVIGPFEKHTTMVDSVEFSMYHHKEHTFYQEYFTELEDTVSHVIKSIKDDFERKLGVSYPFKRFSLVEAPINMYSYLRNWSLATESMMPEMVFFPENGGGEWRNDLQNSQKRNERRMERSNEERSEKDMQVELLKGYIGHNFINPSSFFFGRRREGERSVENWGRYQIFPQYFTYTNHIKEDDYPLLTIAIENYLHQRLVESRRRDLGGLSGNDEVILKLRENSLKELIEKEDVNTLGNVFASKGSQLFSNLQVNTGQSNFDKAFENYLMETRFQNQDVSDFNKSIQEITKLDFDKVYNNWLNEAFNPAFLFSSVDVFEVKEGKRNRYFVKLTVANKGDADGIIGFTVREGNQRGGRGRFRSRFQMDAEQDNQVNYSIEAGKSYDIGFLLDEAPREIQVNTFLAANIPSNQTLVLNEVNRNTKRVDFYEGIRESSRKMVYRNSNEFIVDNEDEGFSLVNTGESRTVKDWWISKQNEETEDDSYGMVRFWSPPVKWKPVAGDKFFWRISEISGL